ALVGVGEVEAGTGDLDQHLAIFRLGGREVDELQHLGSTELADLDRAHRPLPYPASCLSQSLARSRLTRSPPRLAVATGCSGDRRSISRSRRRSSTPCTLSVPSGTTLARPSTWF